MRSLLLSLQLPATRDEWSNIAEEFNDRWNFPNCIGAIDGKHIEIKKPANSGSFYYNYKNNFSIVLMAVVNAKYEFIMADVGINGRVSDGGVFSETKFGRLFHEGSLNLPEPQYLPNSTRKLPYVFVGDNAFPLTENLMKPYAYTEVDAKKQIFNYRLSRARRIVENAFGMLSAHFGVLRRAILLSPEKAQVIVLACCYLHNYLAKRNVNEYIHEIGNAERIEVGQESSSANMTDLQHARYNRSFPAKQIRDTFCEYFNSEGKVAWQNKQ